MKTIGYTDEVIWVPNTSVFLKASENIVMDISKARIPDGITLFDVDYQNTTSVETLTITWKYDIKERRNIRLVCEYTRGKKVLDTRIEADLWSRTADTVCDKEASVYNEHHEGLSNVIEALRSMPDKFNELLSGVNRIVNGYMMKCSNNDTDFILEYNDFATEFEPTLKKHGFSMCIVPCRSDTLGGYYIRIYDGDDYDDSDNTLSLDTEDMEINETDGIFEDVMGNVEIFTFKSIAGLFECAKIIFDAGIKYRDMHAALEKKLKPHVKFD